MIRKSLHATKPQVGEFRVIFGTPQQIEAIVNSVENARRQVGRDGIVMFDAHCAMPPPCLIQFAAAIKPYDLLYIEEPAVPGKFEVFKRLQQQISIPLAVGEQARTIWARQPACIAVQCRGSVFPDPRVRPQQLAAEAGTKQLVDRSGCLPIRSLLGWTAPLSAAIQARSASE